MPDPTFAIADTNDADLQNFFSRPIKTRSYSWTIGSNFFQTFNPWSDFFENPRVLNRITNYNLLRCKLKVRLVLNGNGFYYGRAIASYNPMPNLDQFTKDRSWVLADVVAASQRPHVYLDPTNSLGGTLTLPFCWYENALRIPAQDWREMGKMHIHGMQQLKHANGATDDITLSVFVWAEDVSLAVPTSNEPSALSPQMGEVNDEFKKDGAISKPANMVAKVAGALEGVPTITPFAKATKMAANAVSGIASHFGYSRPNVLADENPYRPAYVGNMTNANASDTSVKLTLDGKQELSVDPRTMGLGGKDEMTVKSIATRESYLTSFNWAKSATAETLLWNSEVNPVTWTMNGSEIHMPACCFASLPFKFWRGTMKYRFQIVASAYHKGRIKVTYDPSYAKTNEYNTNYTHIIDLAKEKDFTLEVGWGNERSMVKHRTPGVSAPIYATSAIGTDPGQLANGVVSVYVVNDLTTPNSTANNDVQVNVFVSAGDNFEVFDPSSENIQDLVWFQPQMGDAETVTATTSVAATLGTALVAVLLAILQRIHSRIDTMSDRLGSMSDDLTNIRVSPRDEDTLEPQTGMIYEPQMGEASESHPDADNTMEENAPMRESSSEHIASHISPSDMTGLVYFGDPVTSFRQCLKRYNYYRTWTIDQNGPLIGRFRSLPDFPLYRGYAPGAIDACNVPTYPTGYNYCEMTLLNYLTPAFTCRRGGLRMKYIRFGGATAKDDLWYVTRNESPGLTPASDFTVGLQNSDSTDAQTRQYVGLLQHTWDGAHATSIQFNPTLEVEFPFYTNIRFSPAKYAQLSTDNLNHGQYHDVCGTWQLGTSDQAGLHCFVSTGEDFSLAFFTGCPVAYFVSKGNDPATT